MPLSGGGAPYAALSLAAAGDMGFGDDENRSRRAAWLREAGFDPRRAGSVDLVHSRKVVAAERAEDCRGLEADGIVAPGRGAELSCLVITVADCMPIFLFDSATGAYGLLHSGWKGTGILAEAVSTMARLYGTRPADVSATFGPRIGPCCYAVDEARASAFEAEFGPAAVSRAGGGLRLDLVAANLAIAGRLGLGAVEVVDACTYCGDGYGSFRRQGPGRFTRMAAVIGYRASPRG